MVATYAIGSRVIYVTGGKHIYFVTPDDIERGLKMGFFIPLLSFWTNSFIKIGIALVLMRIKKEWRVGLWLLIGSSVLVAILSTVFQLVTCSPIRAFWTLEMRLSGKYCWAPGPSVYPYIAWGCKLSQSFFFHRLDVNMD
jgi:hypothetical protein